MQIDTYIEKERRETDRQAGVHVNADTLKKKVTEENDVGTTVRIS